MKPGDLCRVRDDADVPSPIRAGDLAFLTEIDWDHRHSPHGIIDSRGRKITGRGFFFFPSRPEVQSKFKRDSSHLGVMLLFENFEVISETG
jgi:hypothetical protein